jgi:hypothetical protein
VKVLFVRGVVANFYFVLMFGGDEMVQTPRQPKHGIGADERPCYYSLFWLISIFHRCKGMFYGIIFIFLIVKNGRIYAVCGCVGFVGWVLPQIGVDALMAAFIHFIFYSFFFSGNEKAVARRQRLVFQNEGHFLILRFIILAQRFLLLL